MNLAADMLGVGDQGGRVLILDGADCVGGRVVDRLIESGYTDLRVGCPAVHEHRQATPEGVECVPFVWEDEATFVDALKDITTVFVTLPTKPDDWDSHFPNFLNACIANQVKRVVKLSFYHAIKSKADHMLFLPHMMDAVLARSVIASHDGFHDIPLVHKHALCDGDLVLQKQHFEVTILFASHLMSNIFRYGFQRKGVTEKNELYGASNGMGVNYVSPNDVADMAVKAIFEKTHNDQAYILTGPSAIKDEEVAAILSEKLGHKVAYVEKPLDFFDKDTAAIEKIKATGEEEKFPKGDIKKVLGKDAETFRVYLSATNRMTPWEKNVIMSSCFVKTVDDSKSYDEFLQLLESSSPNEKMQQMAQ